MATKRDPELTDEELQKEIELVSEFVVAAAGADGQMTEEQIDAVLGIDSETAGRPAQARTTGHPPAPDTTPTAAPPATPPAGDAADPAEPPAARAPGA